MAGGADGRAAEGVVMRWNGHHVTDQQLRTLQALEGGKLTRRARRAGQTSGLWWTDDGKRICGTSTINQLVGMKLAVLLRGGNEAVSPAMAAAIAGGNW
jgi:hypothetical protein